MKTGVSKVLYHEKRPSFFTEIKIKLPTFLHKGHHLLVTFYHVYCAVNKKKGKATEIKLGHTYIRLFPGGIIKDGSYSVPVAYDLPSNYLDIDEDENDVKVFLVHVEFLVFHFYLVG